MKTKKNKGKMVVTPMSEADLENMRLVLRLKVEQDSELHQMLIESGGAFIIEDCTRRQRGSGLFWGAALIDGSWDGQNWLGKLWLRDELAGSSDFESSVTVKATTPLPQLSTQTMSRCLLST